MKDDYHKRCVRVIAWDDTAQEMQAKKVHSKNGPVWGKPQVVQLKWKCTGMPTAVKKHNYLMEYSMCDKQEKWHTKCDCIVIVTVKRAEDWDKAELEVKSSFVNLFGIDSNQSKDDPPSPPPQCRKRYSEERHKVDKNNENSADDDGGGGKQGRGYGGSGSGGGKRKIVFKSWKNLIIK